jgi:hypothetical protein
MSGARGTIRVMAADWFERLTGFREEGYELTRSRFVVFWWPVQVRQRPVPHKFGDETTRQMALF